MRLLLFLFLLPLALAQGLCGIDVTQSHATAISAEEVEGGIAARLTAFVEGEQAIINAPVLVVVFSYEGNVEKAFVVYTNESGELFIPSDGGESFYLLYVGTAGEEGCLLKSYLSSLEGFAEWWEGQGKSMEELSLSQFPSQQALALAPQLEDGTPLTEVALLPTATLTFTTRSSLVSPSQLPPELCLPLAAFLGVALASFFARGINPFFWMGLRVRMGRALDYRSGFRQVTKRSLTGRAKGTIQRAASVGRRMGELGNVLQGQGPATEGKPKGVRGRVATLLDTSGRLLMKPYELTIGKAKSAAQMAGKALGKVMPLTYKGPVMAAGEGKESVKEKVKAALKTKATSLIAAAGLWGLLRLLGVNVGGTSWVLSTAREVDREAQMEALSNVVVPALQGEGKGELWNAASVLAQCSDCIKNLYNGCDEECREELKEALEDERLTKEGEGAIKEKIKKCSDETCGVEKPYLLTLEAADGKILEVISIEDETKRGEGREEQEGKEGKVTLKVDVDGDGKEDVTITLYMASMPEGVEDWVGKKLEDILMKEKVEGLEYDGGDRGAFSLGGGAVKTIKEFLEEPTYGRAFSLGLLSLDEMVEKDKVALAYALTAAGVVEEKMEKLKEWGLSEENVEKLKEIRERVNTYGKVVAETWDIPWTKEGFKGYADMERKIKEKMKSGESPKVYLLYLPEKPILGVREGEGYRHYEMMGEGGLKPLKEEEVKVIANALLRANLPLLYAGIPLCPESEVCKRLKPSPEGESSSGSSSSAASGGTSSSGGNAGRGGRGRG